MKNSMRLCLVPAVLMTGAAAVAFGDPFSCSRQIKADVVALDQAFYVNRIGALQTGGMIFALRSDVVSNDPSNSNLNHGHVMLRPDKRARPIVLRMNEGDCLTINFQNLLSSGPAVIQNNNAPIKTSGPGYNPKTAKMVPDDPPLPSPAPSDPYLRAQSATRAAGIHVMGMQPLTITSDGSWVGANDSSLVQPGQSITYRFYAASEGAYLLYSTGANVGDDLGYGGQLSQGLFGAVTVQPQGAEWYRSQVTHDDMNLATLHADSLPSNMTLSGVTRTFVHDGTTYSVRTLSTSCPGANCQTGDVIEVSPTNDPVASGGILKTVDFHPVVNYQAVYPSGLTYPSGTPIPPNTPILAMLDSNSQIVHSDLTAIITGPNAGLFPAGDTDPVFSPNPSYPQRLAPYREFVIHYHDDFEVGQAFPEFTAKSANSAINMYPTMSAGRDFFAINYGIAAIGPEVWSNRLGVGPMAQCATCRFEEFFLSSWAVGDPAMVVDFPANSVDPSIPFNPNIPDANIKLGPKATKAFYPDDPSNVYHSYLSDNTKFRILHAGTNITHVHHQHAHQWLHSPDSDEGHYRDSQMISPGAAYTLDYVYRGSGNKNLTVGDSIFHCHFYPHFAQGMWSLWRVHDVFEYGTVLDSSGKPDNTLAWNRALPDGEISTGTPTPAVVPMPTYAMAPLPARVKICPVADVGDFVKYSGSTCPSVTTTTGYRALVNDADLTAGLNPGFPFFVPGLGGQRAPAPPLDFAPDDANPGKFLDGGLPRHVVMQELGKPCTAAQISAHPNLSDDPGCVYEQHNQWDFSKFNDTLKGVEVDEKGTNVEKAAMQYHATRTHPSFTPGGQAANFITNGQGPVSGAPYANPAVELNGSPVTEKIVYKAADIQTNVVLNKKGWHYPQQRMIALWGDVNDILTFKKRPEPLFFRVNSGTVVEYWQANLVPNYYELDDFQVRTPTDILGQHIHLVKFDVTSSDGAANGYNYEDGTLSPDEVREVIHALDKNCSTGTTCGLWSTDGSQQTTLTAKSIPFFGPGTNSQWLGAQATIQRWYADPLLDNSSHDRTMQTVFTHDHFGPSTHQQIGLYAGLVIEPQGSKWFDSATGAPLGGTRDDGGPTSWQAMIVPPTTGPGAGVPYREFMLEFQDRQLAYSANSPSKPITYTRNSWNVNNIACYFSSFAQPPACTPLGGLKPWGWSSANTAVNKPFYFGPDSTFTNTTRPKLITNQTVEGTFSLNYSSEPLPFRVGGCGSSTDPRADLANAYQSIPRCDSALNSQPVAGTPIFSGSSFVFTPPQDGATATDPYTPLLRAYEGENVQIRNLVGAHMLPQSFTLHGLRWLFEPAFTNSGFRSTQGMSLSEHYELEFQLPKTSASTQADYLYVPSSGVDGLTGGNWGLLRAYKSPQSNLAPLPPGDKPAGTAGCSSPNRSYEISAVVARTVLPGPLLYNSRSSAGASSPNQIQDWNALMYVRTADLAGGKLKAGVPLEPLILRAAAGDCIEITLHNNLPPAATVLNAGRTINMIGRSSAQNVNVNTSHQVGLHAQLMSFDVTTDDGFNVGLNPSVTVPPGGTKTFHWYAGTETDPATGAPGLTPVEFGAISLSPPDTMMQHPYGMIGGLIIEPFGSTWQEDSNSHASAVVTTPDAKKFREFVAVFQDDLAALRFGKPVPPGTGGGSPPATTASGVTAAINYRSEPFFYRYADPNWIANTVAQANKGGTANTLSDSLIANSTSTGDPQTPVFATATNIPVRMRMLHPAGTSEEVITVHGQVWQEEPYSKNSTVIGDNPLSQNAGSRDTFGANASFDINLNNGFASQGDYLFRTFIGNDFMTGMWGLVRVGAPGQDFVTITYAVSSATNSLTVLGSNTVNPETGAMAPSVGIFSGQGSGGTKLGDATVDPLSGAWTFTTTLASVPDNLTAVSPLGGSYVATVSKPHPSPAKLTKVPTSPVITSTGRETDVDYFRPPPPTYK